MRDETKKSDKEGDEEPTIFSRKKLIYRGLSA